MSLRLDEEGSVRSISDKAASKIGSSKSKCRHYCKIGIPSMIEGVPNNVLSTILPQRSLSTTTGSRFLVLWYAKELIGISLWLVVTSLLGKRTLTGTTDCEAERGSSRY